MPGGRSSKRGSSWLAQATYVAFFLVFVILTLITLVMGRYVSLPIKFIRVPRVVVRVEFVGMWVIGLFYTMVTLRLPGLDPPRHIN